MARWLLAVLFLSACLIALAGGDAGENASDDEDPAELQQELASLQLKKTALLKEKTLMDLSQALQVLSSSGDPELETFQQIAGFAEEVQEVLARARAAASDEEKLDILQSGLDRRKEWAARLEDARALIEAAEEADREERRAQESPVILHPPEFGDGTNNETAEMVVRTARLVQKATREGEVGLIVKFLTSLAASSPETLQKVLNWRDKVGATALHWCAFHGSEPHVVIAESFLLVPGVDGNILDNQNHTACHTACMRGSAAVLAKLAAAPAPAGCDPLEAAPSGFTCLHYAAQQGNAKVLKALKPLLNAKNVDEYSDGDSPRTALFLAVQSGDLASVNLLLEAGASPERGLQSSESDQPERSSKNLAAELLDTYKGVFASLEAAAPAPPPPRGTAEL